MLRKLGMSLSCCFALFSISIGQPVLDDLPRVTSSIAIVNVKLVSAPGKTPQVSTVVIKDGVITQTGQNISIPDDAYRIDGDSLFAYPAFIDAFSRTGIKEQESSGGSGMQTHPGGRPQRPAVDAEGNPSLTDAGITPFISVRSSIDAKDKSIADWRAQGFAIAHVVPDGKMIPGKGALLVLTGKNVDELMWKEDVSLFSQWSGAGNSYPATMIGMMAKWRELYHNASNNVIHEAVYTNATLVSRPNYNQAHEALMPVVQKQMPVFFRAPAVKDISRAMTLQHDLGMRMVIADAQQAWHMANEFKSGSIPLILSLDLPDDKSESKKEKEEKEKPVSVPPPDSLKTIAGEKAVQDPEKEAFEKRRNESLREHRAQAANLAKEKIPFSFGTRSIKTTDFNKYILLMIDQGLSPDQALSALTTQPAKLLGIEKYAGTIETGKMGNIILSNKPIFEKEASIRFMIVEGDLYEYDIKEKKKKAPKTGDESLDVIAGTWSYAIETPDQKREGTFEFKIDGEEIAGKIKSNDITSGNEDLENIVFESDDLSFTFDFEINGQIVELEFNLTVKDESFDGTVTVGEMGTFSITGTRIMKPQQ